MLFKLHDFLLLIVISLYPLEAQAEKTKVSLFSFDSSEKISKWTIRASNPPTLWQLNTDPKYIKQGKGSVLFKAPSAKSGTRWPAAILDNPPISDMRSFDKISLYLFNPLKVKQHLKLQFILHGGAKQSVVMTLKPGPNWEKVSRKLPLMLTQGTVKSLNFYQSDSPIDNIMYIDDVCLAVDPELFSEKVAILKGKIKKSKSEFAELDDAATKLAALEKRLNILTKDTKNLIQTSRELVLMNEDYKKLIAKCNRKKSKTILQEFDRTFKNRNWGYGWQNGATKILRKNYPFNGTIGGEMKVSLARNEREGIQLVLRSKVPARNIKLEVSSLKNTTSGDVLPSENISVLPVGYIDMHQPPYPVDRLGWTADPLLNFLSSFDIEKNAWQPVWLDIYAPADTRPGTYTGKIKITADNFKPLTVPISVKVWNFEIPKSNSLPTAITHCEGTALTPYLKSMANPKAVWQEYNDFRAGKITFEQLSVDAKKLVDLGDKTWDMLIEHRIMPDTIYGRTPFTTLKRTVDAGAQRTNLIYIRPIIGMKKGQAYPQAQTKDCLKYLEKCVPKIKKAGLLDKTYVYAFDEIGENTFFAARDILSKIKTRFPDLYIITTANDITFGEKSGLAEYVDAWVPLSEKYVKNLDKIEAVRKKGKHVWWYVCCRPHPPSVNLFPDQPATAHRLLMGFLVQKYKPEGFLYYQTSKWIENPMITKGPLTDQTGRGAYQGYNGDGMLFYPGPNGPLSCIRLKAMRDGLEDYEYCVLLEKAIAEVKTGKVKMPEGWLSEAKKAEIVPANVCSSLTEYTYDGKVLLDYRNQIAQLLNTYYQQCTEKK